MLVDTVGKFKTLQAGRPVSGSQPILGPSPWSQLVGTPP